MFAGQSGGGRGTGKLRSTSRRSEEQDGPGRRGKVVGTAALNSHQLVLRSSHHEERPERVGGALA